jgi:hypothetical protein
MIDNFIETATVMILDTDISLKNHFMDLSYMAMKCWCPYKREQSS